MKKSIPVFLTILMFFSFCSSSKKMQHYNKFKKEVKKNIFIEFEKYLPNSYENSLMSNIKYSSYYVSFGFSGMDVLYKLQSSDFNKNVQKLYNKNKVNKFSYNSLNLNHKNSEYYSIDFENLHKIAIPIVKDDFCRVSDTCFSWNDLQVVILETGKKKVFSKKNSFEYQPKDSICNYSIGALISKQKHQIIYWFFIYR